MSAWRSSSQTSLEGSWLQYERWAVTEGKCRQRRFSRAKRRIIPALACVHSEIKKPFWARLAPCSARRTDAATRVVCDRDSVTPHLFAPARLLYSLASTVFPTSLHSRTVLHYSFLPSSTPRMRLVERAWNFPSGAGFSREALITGSSIWPR